MVFVTLLNPNTTAGGSERKQKRATILSFDGEVTMIVGQINKICLSINHYQYKSI